jgi:hypothetical protein
LALIVSVYSCTSSRRKLLGGSDDALIHEEAWDRTQELRSLLFAFASTRQEDELPPIATATPTYEPTREPSKLETLEPSTVTPTSSPTVATLHPTLWPTPRPTEGLEPILQSATDIYMATSCYGNWTEVLEHYYVFFEVFNTSLASDSLLEESFRWSYANGSDVLDCKPDLLFVGRVPEPLIIDEYLLVDRDIGKQLHTKQEYVPLLTQTERVEFRVISVQINSTGLFPTEEMSGLFVGGLNQFFGMQQLPIYSIGVEKAPLPTSEPSAAPSFLPSLEPSMTPTQSTLMPSPNPTESTPNPTRIPTLDPTLEPTSEPTAEPTWKPTWEPTPEPTPEPTTKPTPDSTSKPSRKPSSEPTPVPTLFPSVARKPTLSENTPRRTPYPNGPGAPMPVSQPPVLFPLPPSGMPSAPPSARASKLLSHNPTLPPFADQTVLPAIAQSSYSPTRRSPSAHQWERPPSMSPAAISPPSADPMVLLSAQSSNTPTRRSRSFHPSEQPSSDSTRKPSVSITPSSFSSASPSSKPSESPSLERSQLPEFKLREPVLYAVQMILTGVSILPTRSQIVWTEITETAIRDEVITILNNQVTSVDVIVAITSQRPQQATSRRLEEPELGNVSSNLNLVFDVMFYIRAVVADHNVRRYVAAALDTHGDQHLFMLQLRSSGEAAFQNLTSIRLILPPDNSAYPALATENYREPLSTGMTIGITVVSVAGVALIIVGAFMWMKHHPEKIPTASTDQIIGNLKEYDDNDLTFNIMEQPDVDVSTLGDPIPQGIVDAPSDVSLTEESTSFPYDFKVGSQVLPSLDGILSYSSFSEASSNIVDVQTDDDTLDAQYVTEDRIEVDAPPGMLGLVLEGDSEGIASVYDMKELSPLADRVQLGDKLVSVDDIDVSAMPVHDVMNLIASRQASSVRRLIFSRPKKKNGH